MESLASVTHTEKNLIERPRLGGAFASYVRHRGEPDGKTMEPSNVLISASRQPCQNGGGIFTVIYFYYFILYYFEESPHLQISFPIFLILYNYNIKILYYIII